MKLIFLLPDLKGGGAQKMIINMANEFAARNHDVTLITLSADGAYRNLIENKVRYKGLGKKRVGLSFFALRRELQKTEADILISTLFHVNVIALMVKTLTPPLKTPIIIREANTLTAQSKHTFRKLDKIIFFLTRFFYPFANHVVAPSQGVYDDLIKRIPKLKNKISIIPNPVDLKKIDSMRDEPLDAAYEIPENFILSVGRLVHQKGYDILIKAWAPLCKSNKIPLVILGEGPEKNHLIKLAKKLEVEDFLILPGFDPNPYKYMSKAKLFVLSSYHEGLPNALLQALACGTHVVATDCPSGPAEILLGGKLGPLVKPGSATELKKKLETELMKPTSSPELLRQHIEKNYESGQIAKVYASLFQQVVFNYKTPGTKL